MLKAEDLGTEQSLKISWTDPYEMNRLYSLKVNTFNQQWMFQQRHPYHVFTAPKGAPPCEVYNISVTATATYVGANYTGAGCSVLSPVLSVMIPSRPALKSSHNYSIGKQSGELILKVFFQVNALYPS